MYPSQTSLIPVTVSLSRFFIENGFESFSQKYPYWYLGSTDYKYLIGPVVPLVTTAVHKLFSHLSIFDVTILLVFLSYTTSVIGWLIFVKALQNRKYFNYILLIVLLILPWRLFSQMTLDEGSFSVARNLIPFVLIMFLRYIRTYSKTSYIGLISVITLSLIINTGILPILVIGIFCTALSTDLIKGKTKDLVKKSKEAVKAILFAVVIVTLWYGLSYWKVVLFNPTVGGVSLPLAFKRLFDLVRNIVPVVAAVIGVYFNKKIKGSLSTFTMYWIFAFLFLSLFRFIGDWDFWQDWSRWFFEIEVGIAILLSGLLQTIIVWLTNVSRNFLKNESRNQFGVRGSVVNSSFGSGIKNKSVVFVVLIFMPIFFTWRIYVLLGKPKILSNNVPEAVSNLTELSIRAGNKVVFLSGSTVFWADALYDIYQVRGGNDSVAIHPTWDKAAYEFREGSKVGESSKYLRDLSVEYVLVHSNASKEFYQDFRNPSKWESLGVRVWENNGDMIYKVNY